MVLDLKKIVGENIKLKKRLKAKHNILSKSVINKPVVAISKTTYRIPNRKVEDVFHDENRFFKGEIFND